MEPLRIHAPAPDLAELLRARLADFRAGTETRGEGTWVVTVPLRAAPHGAVPRSLAATREWLDECGLTATSVELDGHAHLIRAQRFRSADG